MVPAGGNDEVGLARKCGDAALEPEGVLALDSYLAAAFLELSLRVGQERGMVDLPLGEVEVGWPFVPTLEVSTEPGGEFT